MNLVRSMRSSSRMLAPNGLTNADRTITRVPGLLHHGWNVIEPRYLTGGGAWVQWNRYIIEVIGPELGTFLLLR